ncbi:hypothetical protein [Rhizobium sp. SG570]|uniref:hypothetical protein n=1 Tax=Rhizobium sp. SG570 TaxID=2587113 RepID=UPI0014453D39|nr:hypothetical protein [Rhizobium sp. SG570]NKJ33352.1 hypothetical protein [Rhizobium sp. SG570]
MTDYHTTADASKIYRDTASAPMARDASASDVGNAVAIMRDTKIITSSPVSSTVITVLPLQKAIR